MFHQLLTSVLVRATEIAVVVWLVMTGQLDLVEVVLVLMLAIRFLFVILQLLLVDILIAVYALTTVWVVEHCLFELTFTAFRKFVDTNDLVDPVQVYTRETQARGIACQTILK
jgi:hypothetical protein